MKEPYPGRADRNSIPSLTLITGGARSGKSRHAEQLARLWGKDRVAYIATARVTDDTEFRSRIRQHRERRPISWLTIEEPLNVSAMLSTVGSSQSVVLVDCLTLLVTNWLFQELEPGDAVPPKLSSDSLTVTRLENRVRRISERTRELVERALAVPAHVIMVTNEVGQGIVPVHPLSRYFRDALGWANQIVAARADRVDWLVSGIPVTVKPRLRTCPGVEEL